MSNEQSGKEKSKRVLAVCNTPFQLICIIWLRISFFRDAIFDVIITNQVNDAKNLTDRVLSAQLFNNVTLVCDSDYSNWRGAKNSRPKTKLDKLRDYYGRGLRRRSLYRGSTKYDEFLLFNHSRFSLLLFERLWQRNSHIQAAIYEEGIGSYNHISRCYYDPKYAWECRSLMRKINDRVFRRPCITENIRRMYVFIPELLNFHPPIEIVRIPPLDANCQELTKALFSVFNCENAELDVTQDVILFEESYAADGLPFNYMPVLEALDKAFGKENIVVKKHPRSKIDLFTSEGYAIFPNSSAPWEVILLKNTALAKKTWVSYCSGSMLCAYFYFGLPVRAISMMDAVKQPLGEIQLSYFRFIRDHLFSLAPQYYTIPASVEELEHPKYAPSAAEQATILPKDTSAPVLSVVFCVYNGECVMRTAIESVLKQDYDRYELLCIDDGSKDGTLSIFREYAAKDPHIVVIQQEKNTGLFLARCNGINRAKGDYILFLDADDYYAKGAFKEIAEKALFYHPDVFHYNVKVISEDPSQTAHIKPTERFHSALKGAQDAQLLLKTTFQKNRISRSMWSKAFRRGLLVEAIADVDNTRVDYGDDAYLIFRAFYYAASYYGDPSDKQYYVYRYSPDLFINESMTTNKFNFAVKSWGRVQKKCKEFLEKRGAFEADREAWIGLSENIMLGPSVHFLLFRVSDEQRGECFATMTEYWDNGRILSKIKAVISAEINGRIQAQRTLGYRVENRINKGLRKAKKILKRVIKR
jgi:glycosyltransferase involved in cell wall biosynthesis